jgi:alkylmercury lyase
MMADLQVLTALDPSWSVGMLAAQQTALPAGVRRLHQAMLRFFLDHGAPPQRSWLHEQASQLGADLDDARARLAAGDLAHLDADGTVQVAYPFSGVPSGHLVQPAGAAPVWAMCAIDALGIPLMAGRDATITATDPHTDEPIRIEISGGQWRWDPPSIVVLMAHRTPDSGPAAQCACPHVNFYTSPAHAHAYLEGHPELSGQRLLGRQAAIQLARHVFGALLHPADSDTEPRAER